MYTMYVLSSANMKYNDLKQLNALLYFSTNTLHFFFKNESMDTIRKRLSQMEKSGKIIRLKKNMYITKETYNDYKAYPEYIAILACVMKTPSYLTGSYVLRRFDVISEATYGYTLATTKTRSVVNNMLGIFNYSEVKYELFTGYNQYQFLNYNYYMATKAKALFDWIYFRLKIIPQISSRINLIEDLRLNLEGFSQNDFDEMLEYARLSGHSKRLTSIINNLNTNAHNN